MRRNLTLCTRVAETLALSSPLRLKEENHLGTVRDEGESSRYFLAVDPTALVPGL